MTINKLIFMILLFVVPVVIFLAYQNKKNNICYEKCSNYHYLEASKHWNYEDYFLDINDTIWADEECYNDWCICIDECKPGLCCKLLD